ncbi:MAG: TolC family protein [Steroidobacteraceae bacterium]
MTHQVPSGVVMLMAALLILPLPYPSAHASTIGEVMDALVRDAEVSSLELAGADADVAGQLAALDAARARFLPSIDLDLRYSRADGGRSVSFPNPAIPGETLSFNFLRSREQESTLRLTQPLFDRRISSASRVAAAQYEGSLDGREALRARLSRDIRQGFLAWLTAGESVGILEASLEAATENERVNRSLYQNGKVTRDQLLRAEADRLEVEEQLTAARAAGENARRYVNLLRSRPLDEPLAAAAATDADIASWWNRLQAAPDSLTAQATRQRRDLRQLDHGIEAAAAAEDLARAAFVPRLALAVDTGIQGEAYGFGADDRFTLASLVLRFNLFSGGADRAAVREARAISAQLRAQRERLTQQVGLEVAAALQDYEVAEASLRRAEKRVEAAEGAFEIARRKRDLGQIPQVEFIDSRRALTQARLSRQFGRYEALGALVAIEYAIGAFPR